MIVLDNVMLQHPVTYQPGDQALNCRKSAAGPCVIEAEKKLVTIK